ncbi:uncharacterized protein TNCV_4839741 [Trichonephila clavipes]|nr:uncharacterized protein TNCV_4839741 [Trichonephila clavipes]
MDPSRLCPGKGLVLPAFNADSIASHFRFLILSLPNNEMSQESPFAIQKALKGIDSTLTVTPHKSLNSCRGVISEPDLLCASEAEVLEGLSDRVLPSPKLPTTIKAGYLNCKVRPYVPNPLRFFKCQRFRHSQTSCRRQLTCSRCASVGHASIDCILEPKFPAVTKSSISTQAQLLPSTSSATVTSSSESQPLIPLMDTAASTSNSLSTSTASSSSTLSISTPLPACPVHETTDTLPATSQDAKETSKPRRKKRPPKNTP